MSSRRAAGRAVGRSQGFAAVVSAESRVLVLGTLPGPESLRRQQYYAQPRNAFWRILGDLCGAGPELGYEARLAVLLERGIALWDVCQSAHRPTALDADIAPESIELNDFAALYRDFPRIERVCCNGRTAAELYRRRVLPRLAAAQQGLVLVSLPSTSPAHAVMRYEEKRERWRVGLAG